MAERKSRWLVVTPTGDKLVFESLTELQDAVLAGENEEPMRVSTCDLEPSAAFAAAQRQILAGRAAAAAAAPPVTRETTLSGIPLPGHITGGHGGRTTHVGGFSTQPKGAASASALLRQTPVPSSGPRGKVRARHITPGGVFALPANARVPTLAANDAAPAGGTGAHGGAGAVGAHGPRRMGPEGTVPGMSVPVAKMNTTSPGLPPAPGAPPKVVELSLEKRDGREPRSDRDKRDRSDKPRFASASPTCPGLYPSSPAGRTAPGLYTASPTAPVVRGASPVAVAQAVHVAQAAQSAPVMQSAPVVRAAPISQSAPVKYDAVRELPPVLPPMPSAVAPGTRVRATPSPSGEPTLDSVDEMWAAMLQSTSKFVLPIPKRASPSPGYKPGVPSGVLLAADEQVADDEWEAVAAGIPAQPEPPAWEAPAMPMRGQTPMQGHVPLQGQMPQNVGPAASRPGSVPQNAAPPAPNMVGQMPHNIGPMPPNTGPSVDYFAEGNERALLAQAHEMQHAPLHQAAVHQAGAYRDAAYRGAAQPVQEHRAMVHQAMVHHAAPHRESPPQPSNWVPSTTPPALYGQIPPQTSLPPPLPYPLPDPPGASGFDIEGFGQVPDAGLPPPSVPVRGRGHGGEGPDLSEAMREQAPRLATPRYSIPSYDDDRDTPSSASMQLTQPPDRRFPRWWFPLIAAAGFGVGVLIVVGREGPPASSHTEAPASKVAEAKASAPSATAAERPREPVPVAEQNAAPAAPTQAATAAPAPTPIAPAPIAPTPIGTSAPAPVNERRPEPPTVSASSGSSGSSERAAARAERAAAAAAAQEASAPAEKPAREEGKNNYERAISAQRSGDSARARTLFRSVVEKDPHNFEAQTGLGDAERAQGDKSAAVLAYRRALAENPAFYPAMLGLADTLWDTGDHPGAIERYTEIAKRFSPSMYPTRVRERVSESSSSAASPSSSASSSPSPSPSSSSEAPAQ